jgi:uncharacterized membrane protein YuzA (DUF378 family)
VLNYARFALILEKWSNARSPEVMYSDRKTAFEKAEDLAAGEEWGKWARHLVGAEQWSSLNEFVGSLPLGDRIFGTRTSHSTIALVGICDVYCFFSASQAAMCGDRALNSDSETVCAP